MVGRPDTRELLCDIDLSLEERLLFGFYGGRESGGTGDRRDVRVFAAMSSMPRSSIYQHRQVLLFRFEIISQCSKPAAKFVS